MSTPKKKNYTHRELCNEKCAVARSAIERDLSDDESAFLDRYLLSPSRCHIDDMSMRQSRSFDKKLCGPMFLVLVEEFFVT